MQSIKKTKKVFAAKKEVTKKDAKKLKNLLPWRIKENKRLMTMNDDIVRMQGFVIGASVVLIACFVALGIVQAL